jgi:hypothetical protein
MYELTMANYPPVARLLTEEVSNWFMLPCLLHKLTLGFAVVGVINGVILQETFKVAASDDAIMIRQHQRAEQRFRSRMEELMKALDVNNDQKLDLEEFVSIATNPDISAWLCAMGIETYDLQTLFSLVDSDGSGEITTDELIAQFCRLRGPSKSVDLHALSKRLALDANDSRERIRTLQRKLSERSNQPRISSKSHTSECSETVPVSSAHRLSFSSRTSEPLQPAIRESAASCGEERQHFAERVSFGNSEDNEVYEYTPPS